MVMAKTARRDVLRELVQLVRVPDDGGSNLGPFLAANADELAPILSTTPSDLEGSHMLTDDQVLPRLRPRLERACLRAADGRSQRQADEAHVAAERLAAAVQWDSGRAVLPVPLFFARPLWSVPRQHAVVVAEDFEVVVRREWMTDARAVIRKLAGTEVWVDRSGLHLSWCNNRGHLNLRARPLDGDERARALVIALTPPTPSTMPAPRIGLPTLLGEVLAELGFG